MKRLERLLDLGGKSGYVSLVFWCLYYSLNTPVPLDVCGQGTNSSLSHLYIISDVMLSSNSDPLLKTSFDT